MIYTLCECASHCKLHHAFTGAVVNSSAAFGQGIGPVWLENVHCSGTESRLVNCPSRRVDFTYCYYSVAVVTCQGKLYSLHELLARTEIYRCMKKTEVVLLMIDDR